MRSRKVNSLSRAALLAVALAGMPAVASAQHIERPDTAVVGLDSLVVTAERSLAPIGTATASVSRITGAEVHALPQRTLADALRQVPGFSVVDFDGLGASPQLTTRGFYGGGEAEYVVVLLNGKPLNALQTGLVAWDAIPLVSIRAIEVVRGSNSALYGDAALGGVINVITHPVAATLPIRWSLAGGTFGSLRGSLAGNETLLGRGFSFFGSADRFDGYRDHSERTVARAGASYDLARTETGHLTLTALSHWRDAQDPGPLPGDELAQSRRSSDAFYRFDGSDERSHRVGLEGERRLTAATRLSGSFVGERRTTDRIRTIALAPDFADTKNRELRTNRALGTLQFSVDGTGLPVADRLIMGADASYGTIDSRYFAMLMGPRAGYADSPGTRGDLDASGKGDRAAAAAFAQYSLQPTEGVRLSLGARMDWLRDVYTPRPPSEGERLEASHAAFSPKVGVNVRYLRTASQTGHVYVTGGRSFKAPTLDQLFDQRTFPVPFPPFAVQTSNALLEPQHGTNIEAGAYHSAALLPGVHGDLTLSVYQMDMTDELDFDLSQMRYINIGESRHRGVEAGLRLHGARATAFGNYTHQSAIARSGEDAGNQLKAIPQHTLNAGLTGTPAGLLETGVVLTHARGIYLDDANTITLPDWTTVDLRASLPLFGASIFLDVRNVLDRAYSTTGYSDLSGAPVVYYHPAAGRSFELGIRSHAR